jgi:translation initiation factor IF-1
MAAGQEAEGVIEEVLPQGLYRISLDSGEKITASLGGVARQTTVRVMAGDRVRVEISPLDPTRGKIKLRLG